MNRILLLIILLIFIILVSGCSFQEPSIGDITKNPEKYNGKSVVLSGRTMGVRDDVLNVVDLEGNRSVLRSGQYTLRDINGAITVITNSTPKYWESVRITGTVDYSISSCPTMPNAIGYHPTAICTYIAINEKTRTSISCEELPTLPIKYSEDSYHIQLCPVSLSNCTITRGPNCALSIICEDGRKFTRTAFGDMKVEYPRVRGYSPYILIGNQGPLVWAFNNLNEVHCLEDMLMFY